MRKQTISVGSASAYERGDVVDSPFGPATIETDPDDHGRCTIRVHDWDRGENPVGATTFQFHRIIRKWNATGTEVPKPRKPRKPDLSPRGPYATAEDIDIARERGIPVKQVRQERADDDMAALAPRMRKAASKTRKCFGLHGCIIKQEMIDASPRLQASGCRAGSKQIASGDYGRGRTDFPARTERENAAERRHDGDEAR